MKDFSWQTRLVNIQKLQTEVFDLLIIGGGINGAGIARDAAMRGMKVALIEAHDFAFGTSSRSSKLIHGGIRYLENLEFHLVFEALSERHNLFSMAPHLVHPLRFMLPLYKTGRVGMGKMGLGMWLYDALSLFQSPEMHERFSKSETLQQLPFLKEQDLLGAYAYSDAYMDDDRLVHETLRSANNHGAIISNYLKATGVQLDEKQKVTAVISQDVLTGRKFPIKAKHFVSTVGPWSDLLGSAFFQNWKKLLRPTKGIHLTFEKNRLPLPFAVVMAAEDRIVFGIPRHEMVIVGTTDTDFHGNPEEVYADRQDIEYLLNVLEKYFPGSKIKEDDIIASYAGIRPLVSDESATGSSTSREHSIFTDHHGVTFVVGGKYTTSRLVAQQALDHCLLHFPIESRVLWGHCSTNSPLNPLVGEDFFDQSDDLRYFLEKKVNLTPEEALWLSSRHGFECMNFVERYGAYLSSTEYEVMHAISSTMCMNLLDFFRRRVPYFLAQRRHGVECLNLVEQIFMRELGLTRTEVEEQKNHYLHELSQELSWRK